MLVVFTKYFTLIELQHQQGKYRNEKMEKCLTKTQLKMYRMLGMQMPYGWQLSVNFYISLWSGHRGEGHNLLQHASPWQRRQARSLCHNWYLNAPLITQQWIVQIKVSFVKELGNSLSRGWVVRDAGAGNESKINCYASKTVLFSATKFHVLNSTQLPMVTQFFSWNLNARRHFI